MIGADINKLSAFLQWANQQRTVGLQNGIDLRVVSALLSDGKLITLHWDTGIVDGNGNTLPPDWRVEIPT